MKAALIFLATIVSFNSYAFSWQDLWATKDQQAQTLVDKGQFKKAEGLFQNNEWRATAAYRAGNYEQAAKEFGLLKNEQGFYNQGNALAHQGLYEQAIKAYDRALMINPDNKDAIYNRKLIEELLKKDKQHQENKEQQSQQQNNKNQQSQDQQGQGQQNNDQQNKDQEGKDQQGKDQQGKDQQGKDQQGKDQQGKDQQGKDQQSKDQQGKDQQGKDQQDKDQPNKDSQDESKKTAQQHENKAAQKGKPQSVADREKQQAKEQWLRLIPDDPGGLMREKFLRDHIRRQRGWYQ